MKSAKLSPQKQRNSLVREINETDRTILLELLQKTKLTIPLLTNKFLLEKDDDKTLQALLTKKFPNYFSILIVKEGGPKTKANACNYGLRYATGELLVIYDAEDVPEKEQLLKAVKKFKSMLLSNKILDTLII